MYLDELRLELQEVCGVSISLSTIWRTLKKGGYSMKKVRNWWPHILMSDWLLDSLAGLHWSVVLKCGLTMHFVLASIQQINLFLLMKVLWTVEQHTVAMPEQYMAEERLVKHSSAVDDGM